MIEELKKGWTIATFGDVVERVAETGIPTSTESQAYIGLEHMEPDSFIIDRWGSDATLVVPKTWIRKGDVLFARRNTHLKRCAIAPFDTYFSPDGYAFRTKSATLLQELLLYVVASDDFMNFAIEHSSGTHSKRVKWSDLVKYEFTLPPIEEQKQISQILSKSVNYAATLHKYRKHCENLIDSFLLTYFDPKKLKVEPLYKYCDKHDGIRIGPFGSQLHQYDYQIDGIPVVMPVNIINNKIVESKIARITNEKAASLSIHKLIPGDILLPRRGDLNKRAIVREHNTGWICGTGAIRVRVKQHESYEAVFRALSSPHSIAWLNANAVGTTMPNLNSKIVANIPVAIPSGALLDETLFIMNTIEERRAYIYKRQQSSKRILNKLLGKVWG